MSQKSNYYFILGHILLECLLGHYFALGSSGLGDISRVSDVMNFGMHRGMIKSVCAPPRTLDALFRVCTTVQRFFGAYGGHLHLGVDSLSSNNIYVVEINMTGLRDFTDRLSLLQTTFPQSLIKAAIEKTAKSRKTLSFVTLQR